MNLTCHHSNIPKDPSSLIFVFRFERTRFKVSVRLSHKNTTSKVRTYSLRIMFSNVSTFAKDYLLVLERKGLHIEQRLVH